MISIYKYIKKYKRWSIASLKNLTYIRVSRDTEPVECICTQIVPNLTIIQPMIFWFWLLSIMVRKHHSVFLFHCSQ